MLIALLMIGMQADAPPSPAPPSPPAKPKLVCRREEVTGSIMPGKRICHTAADWTAIDANNQRSVSGLSNRSALRTGAGAGAIQ